VAGLKLRKASSSMDSGLRLTVIIEFYKHELEQACQTGGPHAAPLLVLCGPNRNFHYATIQSMSLLLIFFSLKFE